jgi:hypothetical protein
VGKVVTAYVLLQTEVGKAGQVASAATEINVEAARGSGEQARPATMPNRCLGELSGWFA